MTVPKQMNDFGTKFSKVPKSHTLEGIQFFIQLIHKHHIIKPPNPYLTLTKPPRVLHFELILELLRRFKIPANRPLKIQAQSCPGMYITKVVFLGNVML